MVKTIIHVPESILTSLKGKLTADNGKTHNVLLDVDAGDGTALLAIKKLIQTKNPDAIKTLGLTDGNNIEEARKALDAVWIDIDSKKNVMITNKCIGFMLFKEASEQAPDNPLENSAFASMFNFNRSAYQMYRAFHTYAHPHAVIAMILDRQDITGQVISSLVRYDLLSVWPVSDRKIFIMFQNVPKENAQDKHDWYYKKPVNHPVMGEYLKAFIAGKASLLPINESDIPVFNIPQGAVKTFRPRTYDMDDIIHLNQSNDKAAAFITKVLGNQTKISPPLMPVSIGHIVTAVIPSGLLNGVIKTDKGEMFLKGTTFHQVIVKKQTARNNSDNSKQVASRKIKQSEITALDTKRNILYRIVRDAGIQSIKTVAGEEL